MLETMFDFPCEVHAAQLNCVAIRIQHLRGEHYKRRRLSSTASIVTHKNFSGDETNNDTVVSLRKRFGECDIKNRLIRKVKAQFHQNNE